MHHGPALDRAASTDAARGAAAEAEVIALLESAIADPCDQLTGAIATLALGSVATRAGGRSLAGLLQDPPAGGLDHVIRALGRGPFVKVAVDRLTGLVAAGGFAGMLAQRTLQRWSRQRPAAVRSALELALGRHDDPAARAVLVETLGLVPGADTSRVLRRVAADQSQDPGVRAAAVAALGDRGSVDGDSATRRMLVAMAEGAEPLASVARLALDDLELVPAVAADPGGGLTVAQLFLHADIDGDLTNSASDSDIAAVFGSGLTLQVTGQIRNSGTVGFSGRLEGDMTNEAAGDFALRGEVVGRLVNDGTLRGAGRVTGALVNQGQATLATGTPPRGSPSTTGFDGGFSLSGQKVCVPKSAMAASRVIAAARRAWWPTCSTGTSGHRHRTRSGSRTSPTSGPTRAGCSWRR